MANLIPFMWKKEQQLIKIEIQGRELSVVFDGTARLGEAVVILVHYVTEHMEIHRTFAGSDGREEYDGGRACKGTDQCPVRQLQRFLKHTPSSNEGPSFQQQCCIENLESCLPPSLWM